MRDFSKINVDDVLYTSHLGRYNLIEEWLKNLTEPITNYRINPDYTIDVDQSCYFYQKDFTDDKFPDFIQFNKINGDFYISYCNLTSLKGCPKEVNGLFNCTANLLTTLIDGPQCVHGGYYCGLNKLTSLKGSPENIGGDFCCIENQLTTLEGGPSRVDGYYLCHHNFLTSLEGGPTYVKGNFYCSYNSLLSLKGAPSQCNYFRSDTYSGKDYKEYINNLNKRSFTETFD